MKESDYIINKVSEVFNVDKSKIIKDTTKRRDKAESTLYRYLCINYLEEKTDYTREIIASELGMKNSSVTIALKTTSNLHFTRDEQYNSALNKLNSVLDEDNKIQMNTKEIRYKRCKLNTFEIKHLKFMIDCAIPNWKLSKHFNISIATIKYHIKKFKENNT